MPKDPPPAKSARRRNNKDYRQKFRALATNPKMQALAAQLEKEAHDHILWTQATKDRRAAITGKYGIFIAEAYPDYVDREFDIETLEGIYSVTLKLKLSHCLQ